ncbi:MAG: histidinol-phosphatase HisJ family protein [Ruminococcaceae bacterium]|nr:histidinol-phosphatase HisJ family protein [Oscillospiraceae bacterium]
MFRCDYHTHTYFSFDGTPNSSPEALCLAAIERGVTDLAITDHFECNWRADAAYSPFDAGRAYNEVIVAKEKYKGKVNLTYGIEIGQINQCPEEAERLLRGHNYEFVICSIHNLRGAPDFFFVDFKKIFEYMPQDYVGHLFERYIQELCESLDVCDKIDTVAHLTYMHRYCALSGNNYDFTKHASKVEELYRKMISRDIALEINVSTLWKGLGFAMPDRELLSLYRDCGGRLVTVGTDSHSPEHIGECIDEGFDLLRSVGLDSVLVVRNGEKNIIKI